MKAVCASHPGGQAFYESHIGKLIEAYLLYAHHEHHDYVEMSLTRIQKIHAEGATPEDKRLRDVASAFDNVRRQHFSRSWIDLENIDRRINLVSSDLKLR